MIYVFLFLMWLMTSNDVHSWQEVTDILYPNWKTNENLKGFIAPPYGENDVATCENSSEVQEIDILSLRMPVPVPSEANLREYQPISWIGDAISQDQPNVLEFMLRHDLILPSVYKSEGIMYIRTRSICCSISIV